MSPHPLNTFGQCSFFPFPVFLSLCYCSSSATGFSVHSCNRLLVSNSWLLSSCRKSQSPTSWTAVDYRSFGDCFYPYFIGFQKQRQKRQRLWRRTGASFLTAFYLYKTMTIWETWRASREFTYIKSTGTAGENIDTLKKSISSIENLYSLMFKK